MGTFIELRLNTEICLFLILKTDYALSFQVSRNSNVFAKDFPQHLLRISLVFLSQNFFIQRQNTPVGCFWAYRNSYFGIFCRFSEVFSKNRPRQDPCKYLSWLLNTTRQLLLSLYNIVLENESIVRILIQK